MDLHFATVGSHKLGFGFQFYGSLLFGTGKWVKTHDSYLLKGVIKNLSDDILCV